MAQTLEDLRSRILTSIFGRRLGLDKDEFLVGPKMLRSPTIELTSSSTQDLPNYGTVSITATSLATSGAPTYQIPLPTPGADLTIINVNARTSAASPGSTAMTLVRTGGNMTIGATEGSTLTTINITPGSAITLRGLTTAFWQVINRTSLAGTILNGTT